MCKDETEKLFQLDNKFSNFVSRWFLQQPDFTPFDFSLSGDRAGGTFAGALASPRKTQ